MTFWTILDSFFVNSSLFNPNFEETNEERDEINEILNEEIEEFDPNEPMRVPFECEHCDFSTTDAVAAASHAESHNDIATKEISRWEPSTHPIPISVIVPNQSVNLFSDPDTCAIPISVIVPNPEAPDVGFHWVRLTFPTAKMAKIEM